jgi:hypothetical protein
MKKPYYVLLTGGKNNAGDFLIKFRAKELFAQLRPDREIVDFNAWEYLDDAKLKVVNQSQALILMGGPALQRHMYPGIYKLRENLGDITVPIIMMGIGWKSMNGEWKDTYTYPLSRQSLTLLERISESGYLSSVRDYHTLNVLNFLGMDTVLMTGCPAYYDLDTLSKSEDQKKEYGDIQKIAFSLGVSFVDSPSMESQMKEVILMLRESFKEKSFEVVFHHSLERDRLLKHGSGSVKHHQKHQGFETWLKKNGIAYTDISGSAESLIDYYSKVDLHIGYRVHAHIFMNSINKLSILISEDGRAKAVKDVIGGIVLEGHWKFKSDFTSKVLNRLFPLYERYSINQYLIKDLEYILQYEKSIDFPRIHRTRSNIRLNYNIMKLFLEQLP